MKQKIGIIENNPDIKEILTYLLEQHFDVAVLPEEIRPADLLKGKFTLLIIEDWLSSRYGSAICHEIKTHSATKHIPVILMSTDAKIKQIAARSRADSYVEKPFDVSHLTSLVQAAISDK